MTRTALGVVARSNPLTGDVWYQEVMRYKNGVGEKTLWINGTWFDDGRPWAVLDAEEVRYIVDVKVSVESKGP